MHLPLTMKEHLLYDYKISGLYCSPVQPQIVHLDAGRVSGLLQICPEGGHNNQTYALSQKGKSLQSQ